MINWAANKEEYNIFCIQHPEMPIFLQDWWLDTVCTNGDWEVCLSKNKNKEITGVLPFYRSRYFGFTVIQMPVLTPFCGVWLVYPQHLKKAAAKTSFEKKVMRELINQLPGTAYYAQYHPIQLTNWLPFYWQKYKQTTFYTFRLERPIKLEEAFMNLKGDTRNKINKANKLVAIFETEDIKLFYKINQLTFERQAKKMPYSFHFLKNLDKVLAKKKQRKIFLAKDDAENYHAAIYLIWDATTVYNFMLGADTRFRSSGAVQLLLWEGIQLAAAKNCTFDFEGSMLPKVEPVFSRFGGKLTPYHKIYKGGNLLFNFLNALKNI